MIFTVTLSEEKMPIASQNQIQSFIAVKTLGTTKRGKQQDYMGSGFGRVGRMVDSFQPWFSSVVQFLSPAILPIISATSM